MTDKQTVDPEVLIALAENERKTLIERMQADPRLGTVSGKPYVRVDGALRPFVEPGAVADVFELFVIPRLLVSTRWRHGLLDPIA